MLQSNLETYIPIYTVLAAAELCISHPLSICRHSDHYPIAQLSHDSRTSLLHRLQPTVPPPSILSLYRSPLLANQHALPPSLHSLPSRPPQPRSQGYLHPIPTRLHLPASHLVPSPALNQSPPSPLFLFLNSRPFPETNRLDQFRRVPSDLHRYLIYNHDVKQRYGSLLSFILSERLGWTDLEPRSTIPFQEECTCLTFYCSGSDTDKNVLQRM